MKFDEVASILRSGNFKAIDDMAAKILSCNDMPVLKHIAENANEFIRLVAEIPKNPESEYPRKNALQAANLINEIFFGSCLCSSYKVRQCSPKYLQSTGAIAIKSENNNIELHEINYSCQCTYCDKNFNVSCVESGHFWRYIWKSTI